MCCSRIKRLYRCSEWTGRVPSRKGSNRTRVKREPDTSGVNRLSHEAEPKLDLHDVVVGTRAVDLSGSNDGSMKMEPLEEEADAFEKERCRCERIEEGEI